MIAYGLKFRIMECNSRNRDMAFVARSSGDGSVR
jgi:hypothetical protein